MSVDTRRPVAVVTGANQGLGRALVAGLGRRLDQGAAVYLTGRDPDPVRDAADQIGRESRRPEPHRLDVRSVEAIEAFASFVSKRQVPRGHRVGRQPVQCPGPNAGSRIYRLWSIPRFTPYV
jgi:NAD(P)-dependent dehydrogenase (short-subunit alcohol dehydrogenase family)